MQERLPSHSREEDRGDAFAVKTAYLFYHFLPPDDVVSALHVGELGLALAEDGMDVTGFPCNRSCRHKDVSYSLHEVWNGIRMERIWRPALRQSSGVGRIFNSIWMIIRWSLLALNPRRRPDVLIVGSDPVLGVLIAPVWRLFKPKTKIVHWCFDLYPEAAFADGILRKDGFVSSVLRVMMRRAYRDCDVIVDIGPRMREMLQAYGTDCERETIVPWAQVEPSAVVPVPPADRNATFGDARLTLLYSGNFGRAHSFEDMFAVTRLLRDDGVSLALSVRGNREAELRAAIDDRDTNIHLLAFAPAEALQNRLASAEVHVITLHDAWTGTVVPSKFFGALAIGRPILFCGNRNADVAQWIERFGLGWVLAPGDAAETAASIRMAMNDSSEMQAMRQRCFTAYRDHFSRQCGREKWIQLLKKTPAGLA
jgi:colanic acid biosynthesis glycosyl transferase WcaI